MLILHSGQRPELPLTVAAHGWHNTACLHGRSSALRSVTMHTQHR